MATYVALIAGKPGAWGAAFPDAPGCTAMGTDLAELHANAVEALREWMEDRIGDGLEPPPARDLDGMLQEAAGRPLMQVPLLLDAGRTVRANITMDAGLLEQVDVAAKLRGLTRSAFLASAARDKIVGRR